MLQRIKNINSWLNHIASKANKSKFTIIYDLVSLKREKLVSKTEYENFKLYNTTAEFREQFLPYALAERYWEILNPRNHACLARDKYLAHLLLEPIGIPVPQLIAYYNPELGDETSIVVRSAEGLAKLLKEKNVKSFVIKPAQDSAHGSGVTVCRELVEKNGELFMVKFDGTEVSLNSQLGKTPMLVEEVIQQTEQMSSLNPSSINTVRMMTALYPDGHVDLMASFIKIGRSGSDVDNAGNGGNVDCAVDTQTGVLYNALQFNSWDDISYIEKHPDSGVMLNGLKLDDWEELSNQVKRYQALIPQLKTIGWDVAITDNGPVIVEINNWWDTTGQAFIGRGWRPEVLKCYNAWKKFYDEQKR